MLGKYGNIYMNYLKECKKEMYSNLKKKGTLEQYCITREIELKKLKYKIEKQLKEKYPQPKTSEFIVMARYNRMIESMADEIVKEEVNF
ncbi:MAG: TnpV protein [Clostridia bacterium]|nr:TnpV protein [Clostridia bacterium]